VGILRGKCKGFERGRDSGRGEWTRRGGGGKCTERVSRVRNARWTAVSKGGEACTRGVVVDGREKTGLGL